MRNLLLLISIILTSSLAVCANQERPNNDFTQRNMFCGGSGTETDPYQICTVEELAALADFVNSENGNATQGVYYKLMNDLDMDYYLSSNGAGYNNGAGWMPIGRSDPTQNNHFKGNFNGNHKVIYNLTINRPDETGVGLFGMSVGGTIQNLGLKNGNITGRDWVGSLLGINHYSNILEPSLVTNCFALCYNVQGMGSQVGGLVGINFGSIIANSYSNSNVTGKLAVSGLVGFQNVNAILTNCYASGNVTGYWMWAAGLVGNNVNGSTIKNCIAANRSVIVTGGDDGPVNRITTHDGGGGPVGVAYNNYAYNEMVVQKDGIDVSIIDGSPEAGTGKDLATFKTFDFYTTENNWHPSSLWSIDTEDNPEAIWRIIDQATFPFLQWQGDHGFTAGIFYVDHTKSGDGSSWACAYPNLADPLILAAKQRSGAIPVAATDTIREIYIAEGTYLPMYNADGYSFTNKVFPETDGGRNNAFVLVEGVKIYGGFVPGNIPTDTPFPDFGTTGRDGVTKLSGDINGDDIPGNFSINRNDNVYHVLIGSNIFESSHTLLDGVTITGGSVADGLNGSIVVNGNLIPNFFGVGMCNFNSSPMLINVTITENTSFDPIGGAISNFNYSSPLLNYVTISGNHAGGVFNYDYSSPVLTNVAISGNIGGGMINQYSCSPVLTNVTISGNIGGISNYASSPVLTNVTISGNTSTNLGGGITNLGSPLVLTNVTISGNSGADGGGIFNIFASITFNNCIIYGNTATKNDNVSNNDESNLEYRYSLIQGSGGSGARWDAAFGIDCGNNIDIDPLFVAPQPASAAPTTLGDYSLQDGSRAINAGSDVLYLAARGITDFTNETDLAGNPRLVDCYIDMGAYESQTVHLPDTTTLAPVSICIGDSLNFYGTFLKTTGTYYHTLTSVNLCDSVIKLTLTVNPVYTTPIAAEICQDDSFEFFGTFLKEEGIYYHTLNTLNKCDSVIKLTLTVNPLITKNISEAICDGDEYDFYGDMLTQAGTYPKQVTATEGCDTLVTLTLTVYLLDTTTLPPASICAGDSLEFYRTFLKTTGTYYHTLTSVNLCDSVIKLTLTVNPVYTTSITAEICQGSSFDFFGTFLKEEGIYDHTLNTLNRCDSVIKLTLTVNPLITKNISEAICDGDGYDFYGEILTQAGTYPKQVPATEGCDTIVTLTLTVNPIHTTSISESICQGDSLLFSGIFLKTAGVYYDTIPSVSLCDSVIKLTLTVNPLITKNISEAICDGDGYDFYGEILTQAGTYPKRVTASDGCDTLVTLTLTVHLLDTTPLPPASICIGDSLDFYGIFLKTAGTYYHPLTSVNLCDSVIKLTLTVDELIIKNIAEAICQGDEYDFYGEMLTLAGTYPKQVTATEGCDTLVTLTLTVHLLDTTPLPPASICIGDSLNFYGTFLKTAGTYYHPLSSVNLCDSVIEITLTVNPLITKNISEAICDDDGYDFYGEMITQAGTYPKRVTASDGCDTLVTLTLTVYLLDTTPLPPASICIGDSLNFYGTFLKTAGTYYHTLTSVNLCDSVIELTLTVNPLKIGRASCRERV